MAIDKEKALDFEQNKEQEELINKHIPCLFSGEDVIIYKLGRESIVEEGSDLSNYLNDSTKNQQDAALMLRFAPDYVLAVNTGSKPKLYFLEVKYRASPMCILEKIKIRQDKKDIILKRDKVGAITKEALLSYKRYYPDTIVLMVCTYNSDLVMAQFVNKIECLSCFRDKTYEGYCNDCPMKVGSFSDDKKMSDLIGDKNAITSVDFGVFIPVVKFFEKELEIQINEDKLEDLRTEVLEQEDLIKFKYLEKRVSKGRMAFDKIIYYKNRILYDLLQAKCDWIDFKVYTVFEDKFFHLDKDCGYIVSNNNKVGFVSIKDARNSGLELCEACNKAYTLT